MIHAFIIEILNNINIIKLTKILRKMSKNWLPRYQIEKNKINKKIDINNNTNRIENVNQIT